MCCAMAGIGGFAAGEVRGGAAASGRAVATAGVGGGGPLVGPWRDRGCGPGVGVVAVTAAAGGGGAGVRGGTVGPGPSARGRAEARDRGGSGAAAGAAGAGGADPAGDPSRRCVDDEVDAPLGRRADRCRARGESARRWRGCCGSRASACRATPRRSRASQHPDRDAQFRYLNAQADAAPGRRGPGDQRGHQEEGAGRAVQERRRASTSPRAVPSRSTSTTSPRQLGKAIPYGVYDVAANTGWVNVGADHDTAAFAVEYDPPLVAHRRPSRLPRRGPVADHRRRRRLQRLPATAVEDRARRAGRRDRPADHRLPPAAGHQQMESR